MTVNVQIAKLGITMSMKQRLAIDAQMGNTKMRLASLHAIIALTDTMPMVKYLVKCVKWVNTETLNRRALVARHVQEASTLRKVQEFVLNVQEVSILTPSLANVPIVQKVIIQI